MPKASSAKAAEVNVPAPANSDKAYTGEKIVKPLDNGGGNGIIGVGSELPMNALTRKEKPDTFITPMPKKQLQRIVKSFKAKGGIIQMSDATDEYLRQHRTMPPINSRKSS